MDPSSKEAADKRAVTKLAIVVVVVVTLTSALVSGVRSYLEAGHAERAMIDRIERDFRDTVASVREPGARARPVDPKRVAPGELGELEKFVRGLMAQASDQHAHYLAEVEALNLKSLLDGSAIVRDGGVGPSRQVVAQARALVDKYEAMSLALIDGVPATVRSSDMSERTKDEVIRGFAPTAEASRSQMSEIWGLERQVFAELEAAVEVLGSTRDKWSLKGGQMVFHDRAALSQLGARIDAIERLTKRQQRLEQHNAAAALSKLEAIKR